jgi:hypothetical protein
MTAKLRRRSWVLLPLPLLLLGWWLWPNGRLARAKELQTELFSDAARQLPPDDRRAKFEELRTVTRQLSDGQRRELGRESQKWREDELRQYVRLSAAEKKRRLDRDIDRQEQMRKRMQANPASRPSSRPGTASGVASAPRGGGGGRPTTPEGREQRRQQYLDHTTPEHRELRDQYRRDLDARRKERGLPPAPPFRGPR